MKKIIVFSIAFFLANSLSAAINADSLIAILGLQKDDTNKVNMQLELADYYATKNVEKSVEYAEAALFLSKELKYTKGELHGLMKVGLANNDMGKVSSAISNFEEVIIRAKELGLKKPLASAYNNLGISYFNKADYETALNYYFDFLKVAEEVSDTLLICSGLNNVANVYVKLQKNEKALEYHYKSLSLAEKLGDKSRIAGSYNNIGIIYSHTNQLEKALEYYEKTLKIAYEINHRLGISFTLSNIGAVYARMKDYDKALEFYRQTLEIKKEIGEKKGIANVQNSIANIYYQKNKFDEAIEYFMQSAEICNEIGEKETLYKSYNGLADSYEQKGNIAKAFEYYKLYSTMKDSVLNESNNRNIADMEARYDSESKSKEIKLLEKDKKLHEYELKRKNLVQYALIGGVLFVSAMFLIIGFAYRQKQKMNNALSLRNKQISLQKKIIEDKNKNVTESILYAQKIQSAIIPTLEEIRVVFPESFVFYRPRDIVSGDFYWFHNFGDITVVALADCTGHGVPGAIMSMVGNDKLTQIVHDENISDPSSALKMLDERISNSLNRSDYLPQTRDGMDIALCAINKKEKFIHYSGANRPLFIIRDGIVREYKATKLTIGGFASANKDFELNKIMYEEGDVVYLFSDGITDQFGGEKGKKYMHKRFKEFVENISSQPIKKHEFLIADEFDKWRGDIEQVDDICVMGIKL